MKVAALIVLCALAVGALAFVLVYGQTMVLERKFVAQFKVVELSHDGTRIVRISGWSGHGFWSVKDVTTQRVDSSIIVLVHLFLARPRSTGGFQYDVPIQDGINQIRFGRDQAVIWSR
jgi:hypothetical protein